MKYKQVSQYQYIIEDGRTIKRKFLHSASMDEPGFNGCWCLCSVEGHIIDHDYVLDDLAARHDLVKSNRLETTRYKQIFENLYVTAGSNKNIYTQ